MRPSLLAYFAQLDPEVRGSSQKLEANLVADPETVLELLSPVQELAPYHRLADSLREAFPGYLPRSLLPEVIRAVRPGDLWVADRNFCTHDFVHQIDQREAAFVIRQHGRVHGREPGEWSSPIASPTGTVSEQALSIDHEGQRKTVRRIRVTLSEPTREGDAEIDLLTNLPASVDAATVARIYRQRWSIEGLFRQMAQTLACEPKTLCQPKAFEFVFCLGLVATHAVQVLQAGRRRVHGAEVWASLSLYYLMWEIHQSSRLVHSPLGEANWDELRRRDESEWLAELVRILG